MGIEQAQPTQTYSNHQETLSTKKKNKKRKPAIVMDSPHLRHVDSPHLP